MLLTVMKPIVKSLLRKYDLRIYNIPKTKLTGFEFWNDLKLIVGKDDPVCLDVGANRGQTITELERLFLAPRIFAFEPSTVSFARLSEEFRRPNIQLYRYGLGSALEQREFINYESSTLSSFLELSSNGGNRFRNVQVSNREIVEVKTVDWFVSQEQLQVVDLLKIDTQGYDLEVLKGAAGSLASGIIKTVLLELNFIEMYEKQGSVHEIEDFLANFNYHLVDYYGKSRLGNTIAWCNGIYCPRPASYVPQTEKEHAPKVAV